MLCCGIELIILASQRGQDLPLEYGALLGGGCKWKSRRFLGFGCRLLSFQARRGQTSTSPFPQLVWRTRSCYQSNPIRKIPAFCRALKVGISFGRVTFETLRLEMAPVACQGVQRH